MPRQQSQDGHPGKSEDKWGISASVEMTIGGVGWSGAGAGLVGVAETGVSGVTD